MDNTYSQRKMSELPPSKHEEFNQLYNKMAPHVGSFINDLVDRINTNGNYEKDNCRWETMQEQSKNRRTCIKIEGFKTAKDYCAANGISYNAYKQKRYKNKLPLPDKPNP